MVIREHVPLASLTTFRIGGNARYVITCESIEDVKTALAFIRECGLSWYVLGGGSNILASDEGYDGIILLMRIQDIRFEDHGEQMIARAGAGVPWDEFVEETVRKEVWGIENLAGIPGTVGASPVQNIGAYGADISDSLLYVEALDSMTHQVRRFMREECAFGYRESYFKHHPELIILGAAFTLSKRPYPRIEYADLSKKRDEGVALDTAANVAHCVRDIRRGKFPDLSVSGTAGSFFKNPMISADEYARLTSHYLGLPGYPSEEGMKVSLAWILDKVLDLRGFRIGRARLFEKQPLVLVTEEGATAREVEALAQEVSMRVREATGIEIEREVRVVHSEDSKHKQKI